MDNKQNFYLKNNEIIEILKNEKTNEYVTKALKTASINYRDFIEFTRHRLNPKTSEKKVITIPDLISHGRLICNTVFDLGGVQMFAARGTRIEYLGNTIYIDDMQLETECLSYKIEYRQLTSDFNDDKVCAVVNMED